MRSKRTARRRPIRWRVTIEALAYGGDGVGRAGDGRVVFVPRTAPGDEIEAELVEEKKGFVRAELAHLIRPSDVRVSPPCRHFLEGCGGCQWQHVAVAAQRAAKEEFVRRALRHLTEEVAPIATPAPEYRWRRRARLHWRRGRVGYAERRSHRLVDVAVCPQLDERLEGAYTLLCDALVARLDGSGELELLLGGRGDVHAVVSGRAAPDAKDQALGLIGLSGIVGIVLRNEERAVVVGTPVIDLADDPEPFLSCADAFAQVSAPGNALLRRLVLEAAGDLSGARVLELFSGSGNFTRDLSRRAAAVVAVEESPLASDLAARNLALRGLAERVTFRAEPARAAVAALLSQGSRFDVVVLDPPRTGLEPGLADLLAVLAPARIVYVSCDPNTLARDLARLSARSRLRVMGATPVDLMPQTFHVETVAWLG